MIFVWLIFALGLWGVALFLHTQGTWLAIKHFRRGREASERLHGARLDTLPWQPISILKPIRGIEPGLRENLRSFFTLQYPLYELIFSIAEESDPAREMIQELRREFPKVTSQLVIGDVKVGHNPKINNLVRSFEWAQYDWVLISDSNVRAEPRYLWMLASEMKSDTGVVTAVVTGRLAQSLGGYLESAFLNTFYARFMLLAWNYDQPCVVGKSMLFRRSTAKRFGGLLALSRYLAEDYMAGKAMRLLGLRVQMLTVPVTQTLLQYSVRDFWLRHVRWGRIRKAQAPLAFVFEPFISCLLSSVMGAVSLGYILSHVLTFVFSGALLSDTLSLQPIAGAPFEWSHVALCIFLLHWIYWGVCDWLVQKSLGQALSFRLLGAWFLRECVALILWTHIFTGSTVNWRGRLLRVERGGVLSS